MTLPALFLPGILTPAQLRYAPLFAALGEGRELVAKELEVYRDATPPASYTIATELDAIVRLATERGWTRFHLFGHSAGGACALAFAALHPERVASLAVDEPAYDFSEDARHRLTAFVPMLDQPEDQLMSGFAHQQVRPGVPLPELPSPPPPWMARRPAGVKAFVRALAAATVPMERLHAFPAAVYYSHGTLSHPRWGEMAHRLVDLFPLITIERFEGRSHFDTSHTAEPERVARALQRLWSPD